MNYEALVLLAGLTWRLIATIRTPILTPIKHQLAKRSVEYGEYMYSIVVWVIAFLIGYGYATMGGQEGGDLLYAMDLTDGYPEIGYAMTAIVIACGSGGLRIAEKLLSEKTDTPPKI